MFALLYNYEIKLKNSFHDRVVFFYLEFGAHMSYGFPLTTCKITSPNMHFAL